MTRLLEQAARLAAGREALLLQAEKVAHSYLRGPHGRRRAGSGEKFWQFRPYVAGDAPRDIDWRQTAKRDDVFVREREHDAAQSLWVFRDGSASMDYASRKGLATKADYAEVVLLAMAFLALEAGERVGVLGASARAHSHLQALPLLQQQLPHAMPDVLPAPPSSHAVAVLASDFYFDLASVETFCAQATGRGCRPVLWQVCDPAEADFDYSGRVRFEDTEAGGGSAAMIVDDADALRDAYRNKFQEHQAMLADITRRHGGVFLVSRTDTPVADALDRCLAVVTTGGR